MNAVPRRRRGGQCIKLVLGAVTRKGLTAPALFEMCIRDRFNTEEFKGELQEVVDVLRADGPLKDLASMRSY